MTWPQAGQRTVRAEDVEGKEVSDEFESASVVGAGGAADCVARVVDEGLGKRVHSSAP